MFSIALIFSGRFPSCPASSGASMCINCTSCVFSDSSA